MNYSNKIKGYQPISLTIYNLFFASMSNETTVEGMIKDVQNRLNLKEKDKPGLKAWKALCKLIIGDGRTATQKSKTLLDPHNEIMLSQMTKELTPFAKELIFLSQEQGINLMILSGTNINDVPELSMQNFGLSFDIGIFDQTTSGELIYNGNVLLYANVAKLAESIGLTWAVDQKTFSHQSRFELRPAWALRMTEQEMLNELKRRKEANLNLLAILD
ncbi:hypothetical protein WG904_18330 [Pedobacter sp. Du54]|uniref:hypothetical protein n=1 Tax=Pedobacter anseongensis TaxID=3133439 RepID=UPI0030AEB189